MPLIVSNHRTIGSIIAVRQGELIPLDGIVVKGVASVDESSISGEATPVEKILESPAYSGTVIQNGYLEIETTSSSTSSTISKISAMVEDAQMNVSPTEMLVNKFAKFYTPLVIVVAALVFLIPLFLGLAGVEAYDGREKTWGERALIVLVTACPCALLMATPTVVICGINGAARLGALIKGGTHLEALGQLNLLAFDKTGTLTEGKFQVVDLVGHVCCPEFTHSVIPNFTLSFLNHHSRFHSAGYVRPINRAMYKVYDYGSLV